MRASTHCRSVWHCRSGVCNLAMWSTGALQLSCCRPTCPSTGSEVGDLAMDGSAEVGMYKQTTNACRQQQSLVRWGTAAVLPSSTCPPSPTPRCLPSPVHGSRLQRHSLLRGAQRIQQAATVAPDDHDCSHGWSGTGQMLDTSGAEGQLPSDRQPLVASLRDMA